MTTITTLFTERFGVQLPLMGAPMAGVSGPALAAAVANAGGLGFLGAAFHKNGEQLRGLVRTPQTPHHSPGLLQLGPTLHAC